MEEEKTTLCYSLGEGLKGRKDSVSARRYIAHMKSEGCFRDADLWEAMAKETLLLCGAVSAAAKGAATLEVSVASSSSATGRFTATRRVKVC